MLVRKLAGATLLLSLPVVAASAQGDPSPQERWAQVAACAGQGDAASRHECVDAILRAAGVLDPQHEAVAQRENFGRVGRQEEEAAATLSAPDRPETAGRDPVAPAPPAALDSIVTLVAAARFANDRHLLVATQEGAVWRQVDDEEIRTAPRPGTPFEVREAALGSYRCTVGRSTHFRCARAD